MRLAHHARLLARRPSFFIRRDYGTHEWVSYAYIVRLSEVDRKKLLSSDDRLRRWYERQLNTENGEAAAAYLRAGRIKRRWLKFLAPPRLRRRK
jgi:hypothetical protein